MEQLDLLETVAARSLLDQLLDDSRLYESSAEYLNLLNFVIRLKGFAPFNAMLLQVQKPGLMYAASRADWLEKFGRVIKHGSRPLLIMWPFGPVALVYDVIDTEGKALPEDVNTFVADGDVNEQILSAYAAKLNKRKIKWNDVDAGDGNAGAISVVFRGTKSDEKNRYRLSINKNHNPNTRFATLAHELGHLFLGHLGDDRHLKIPNRSSLIHAQVELEAESVSYMVCSRNGIRSKSEAYLHHFVKNTAIVKNLDVYQIMRAAGRVEHILELDIHHRMGPSTGSNAGFARMCKS